MTPRFVALLFVSFCLAGCSPNGPLLYSVQQDTDGERSGRTKSADIIALSPSGERERLVTLEVANERRNPIQYFQGRAYFKDGAGRFVEHDLATGDESRSFLPGTRRKQAEHTEEGLFDFVVASGGLVVYLSGTCATDAEHPYSCDVHAYDVASGSGTRLGELDEPGVFGLGEIIPGQNGRDLVWIRAGSGDACGSHTESYVVDVRGPTFIKYSATDCPCGPCVTEKFSSLDLPEMYGESRCDDVTIRRALNGSWEMEFTTASGTTRIDPIDYVGCRN